MQVRFKLDAYNPAEFYGALGLLELLSQQDDGITSHFESDGATGANSTFVLHSDKDIPLPDLRAISVARFACNQSDCERIQRPAHCACADRGDEHELKFTSLLNSEVVEKGDENSRRNGKKLPISEMKRKD